MKRISPVVILFILPVVISEFLTGSTPLTTFIVNPVLIFIQLAFYGSLAIVARELTLRWQKGWPDTFYFWINLRSRLRRAGSKNFF